MQVTGLFHVAIKTNDLDHGPIQCYMTNGLEPDSLILQVQTI